MENLKGQEKDFKRLGVLGNWDKPYVSIAPEIEAEQIRIFGEMYEKGYGMEVDLKKAIELYEESFALSIDNA